MTPMKPREPQKADDTGTQETLGPGDTVTPFALPCYSNARTLAWKPGTVTVVSFCALWCDTWKEQAARLVRAQNALAGLPIDFVTVSVDGRWAERYASGNRSGQVLLDLGSKQSARWGVRAVPYTFVIDRGGVIQMARQGIVRSDELIALLRQLSTTGFSAASLEKPTVYLTFDDFPTVLLGARFSTDEDLLDVLRALAVPATFFCIGEHLVTGAGLACARRAVREGHGLQLHSWSHDAAEPRLNQCIALFMRALPDVAPTVYRAPGHSQLRRITKNGTVLGELRLPTVNPYDFTRPGEAELLRRTLSAVRPQSVLQFHAGVEQTRNVLPDLTASLNRRGFTWGVLR